MIGTGQRGKAKAAPWGDGENSAASIQGDTGIIKVKGRDPEGPGPPAVLLGVLLALLGHLHELALDLLADLGPAGSVPEDDRSNGRAQRFDVPIRILAVDRKLPGQPERRVGEELRDGRRIADGLNGLLLNWTLAIMPRSRARQSASQ